MNGSLPAVTAPGARGNTNGHADQLIELMRTLADPIRLRIVRLLESHPQPEGGGRGAGLTGAAAGGAGGGLSVGELGDILKLPQSTVSRHLKTLADAGMVDARRDGTSMFYRLSEAAGRTIAAHDAAYLDDLGINLKPARALGFRTIKVVEPAEALAELSRLVGFPLDGVPR